MNVVEIFKASINGHVKGHGEVKFLHFSFSTFVHMYMYKNALQRDTLKNS